MEYNILKTSPEKDYELLDSGDGDKLERYGDFVLSRPDPQALWSKRLTEKDWNKAEAVFARDGKSTEWKVKPGVPEKWEINFAGLKFWIKPTAFKHTGLFPEQASNWKWIQSVLPLRRGGAGGVKDLPPPPPSKGGDSADDSGKVKVLNLFGYTGGATLAAAAAGAEVCHVDGSKSAIGWARDNAELSGLKDKPVRWILDDAATFVKREIKRGRKYDGIIMDPPAFGHGPKSEMWKIEEHLLPLLRDCYQILSPEPLFFLINGYASGYSAMAYENNLLELKEKFGGTLEKGELTIEEKSGRLLPCGIFARWSK